MGAALLARAAVWAGAAPGALPAVLAQAPGAAAWGWGSQDFVLGLGSGSGIVEVVAVGGIAGGQVTMSSPVGPILTPGSAGAAQSPLAQVSLRGGAAGRLWVAGMALDGRVRTWAPRYGLAHRLRNQKTGGAAVLPPDGGEWGIEAYRAEPDEDPVAAELAVRSMAAPRWIRRDGLAPISSSSGAAASSSSSLFVSLLGSLPAVGSTETEDAAPPLVVALAPEGGDPASLRGRQGTSGGVLSLLACDGGSGEMLGCHRRTGSRTRASTGRRPQTDEEQDQQPFAATSAEDVMLVRVRHQQRYDSDVEGGGGSDPESYSDSHRGPALRLYTLLSLCEQSELAAAARRRESSTAAKQRRRLSNTG